MAITTQQVEASWKALASWWTPQKSLFENEKVGPGDRDDEIDRVLTVFTSDRGEKLGPSLSYGENCTPKLVAEFMAGLAQRHKPKSLLDPACGYGLLLATAAAASEARILKGIEINADIVKRASKIWGETLELTNGDAISCLEEHDDKYDMVVSDPPLGLRLSESQLRALDNKKAGRDFSSALIHSCLNKLAPEGIGVFNVAPSFLLDGQKKSFLSSLNQAGYRVSACIQVPSGTRHNTMISTYVVVVEAGEQGQVFIGQMKDDTEHLRRLISNLYRRKPKGDVSLGRLCDFTVFRSFDSFVAREQLERLARDWRWTPHRGSDVIKDYEVIRRTEASSSPAMDDDSSSLFLKLLGKPQASRQYEDVSKAREIGHLKVNEAIVEPAFLEYWLNESRIGQLTIGSIQDGMTIPRTRLSAIAEATIYLPPKELQRCVCEGWSFLKKVRSEADELESELSNWTEDPQKLLGRIKSINQEDRYEDWIESLPFPLASILWRHHAAKDSYRERYQVLLHFFEATAAFVATVHLSAYLSSESQWEQIGQDLGSKLYAQGLSLDRATFGAWKLVVERLASACSASLKKADEDSDQLRLLEQIYCTSDRQVLDMLSHKKLLQVLQAANKIRNDNLGHSGAIGEEVAMRIHGELLDLVYQLRGAFGRNWSRYELLQPGTFRYKAGIYHVTCKRIMGTRSAPFEEVEYESTMPLETDALYLFDSLNRTGLKLEPFVEVIPSPERQAVACFIFNRVDRDSARWVSYHFEQEAEISHPSIGVLNALSRLHRFNPSTGSG
jgi:hypothetical protein